MAYILSGLGITDAEALAEQRAAYGAPVTGSPAWAAEVANAPRGATSIVSQGIQTKTSTTSPITPKLSVSPSVAAAITASTVSRGGTSTTTKLLIAGVGVAALIGIIWFLRR